MPGIFIGIGGIGGSIVAQVRQTLELRVRAAGDDPAAREAGRQFRFLLLDTWKDAVSQQFAAAECFDLPVGQDKYDVDRRIDDLYFGDDPTFGRWWPDSRSGGPLKIGDYASGAGQLRLKGKLAYRIHLTGPGGSIVAAVEEQLRQINDVLGPAEGVRTIPIYIVCSLGGGTGSGMSLVFAQHLRERLTSASPLIGVFPLASVAALATSPGDGPSVRANTDAALRELDYIQRMAGSTSNEMLPFFEWPGAGHILKGSERPFSYVYLFGRENANGLAFTDFDRYMRLIAECLVAESFSELIDEQRLDQAISAPHSQFLARLHELPELLGRPTTYASAAVGAVRYPAERVARHLGRRYAARVFDLMTSADAALAEAAAQTFFNDRHLDWDGAPSFDEQFESPLREGTADAVAAPIFPPLDDPNFQKADRAATLLRVDDQRTWLQGWIGADYEQHVTARRVEIVDAFVGPQGHLQQFAEAMLAAGGTGGLAHAAVAIAAVRWAIDHEHREVLALLNGDGPNGRNAGLRAELRDLQDDAVWQAATQRLAAGFGLLRKDGKDAKQTFLKQMWAPLLTTWQQVKRAQAAAAAYAALEAEARRIERTLTDLIEQTRLTRAAVASAAETDLGREVAGGALDVAVLDDARLVDHHFHAALANAEASGAPSSAARLIQSPDGALGTLRRKLAGGGQTLVHDDYRGALERQAIGDGVALLGEEVERLSVWDALAAECAGRQTLNLVDQALSEAMLDVRRQQDAARRAGVPGDGWDAILLQEFIKNKLFECQKRVRPFWKLNNGLVSANEKPYAFTIVARDEQAYVDARTTLRLGDVLEDAADQMNAGRPYHLPGKRQIVLYAREGVAPLCYLDEGELTELRNAAAHVGTHKFLYTDRRFAEVVDPVIKPAEAADDENRYLVGAAFALGLIRRPSPQNGGNGHVVYGGREFASMPTLYRAVKEDPALRAALGREFNAVIDEIPEAQLSGEIQDARTRARNAYRAAVAEDQGDDKRFWQAAERAIDHRLKYGHYDVDA